MRFLADRTTGKLARQLRALGVDVVYWGGGKLEEAAKAASNENRVLLTRSRKIKGTEGRIQVLVLEADDPQEQTREVLGKFRLQPESAQIFSRCLICNEILLSISRSEVEGRVPDFIYQTYDCFHLCPRCRRVYWPGTHLRKMEKEVARALIGDRESF